MKPIFKKNIFREAQKTLALGMSIAKAEFKLKNEGSYLGILWYLLNPMLMFCLLYLVFSDRLGNNISHYPLYLLLGIVMFNFFQSATSEATRSIIDDHRLLIKSINFPRESLIAAVVFKNLFSHLFEIILFAAVFFYFNLPLIRIIYYIAILPFFTLFIFGVSLILAVLTVYFVDTKNIWSFASRLIWLGTPIFYAVEGQTRLFYFNLANPLYHFITAARETVIYGNGLDVFMALEIIIFSLIFPAVGLFIFRRLKTNIAEKI